MAAVEASTLARDDVASMEQFAMKIPVLAFGFLAIARVLAASPCSADCIDYGTYLRWVAGISTSGQAQAVAIAGQFAFVGGSAGAASDSTGFEVIDITIPTAPRIVARLHTPGDVEAVVLSGDYAYVVEAPIGTNPWNGLQVINVADPAHPRIVGTLCNAGAAWSPYRLAVAGRYVYMTVFAYDGEAYHSELQVIDVSITALPRLVGRVSLEGLAFGVAVRGDLAYVANEIYGLMVIDIKDPSSPRLTGVVELPGSASDISIWGSYAYVTDCNYLPGGLWVLDISNPREPRLVARVDTDGQAFTIAISGDHAFLTVADPRLGVQVVDISDPTHPYLESSVGAPDFPTGVAIAGTHAFVTAVTSGLAVLDIATLESAPILGGVSTYGSAVDVAVAGSLALVAEERDLETVDVGDPRNPQVIGRLYLWPNRPDHVTISGSYGYVSAGHFSGWGQNAFLVIDVADSRNPRVVGRLTFPEFTGSANIIISGRYAYLAYSDGGLLVVDVANPAAPRIVGQTQRRAYQSIALSGHYIYGVSGGEFNLLDVIDVSIPESPQFVGSVDLPDFTLDVAVDGTTACVLLPEFGLVMVDVADPGAPRIVGTLGEGDGLVMYRVAAADGYAYVTCRGVGLLVVDIRDRARPRVVGNLSVSGGGDRAEPGERAGLSRGSGRRTPDRADPLRGGVVTGGRRCRRWGDGPACGGVPEPDVA